MADPVLIAIGRRLDAAAIAPVVSPDLRLSPTRPCLVLDLVPVRTFMPGVSATGQTIRTGFAMVSVITAADDAGRLAWALAQQIGDLFPAGLRLNLGYDGTLTVTTPVHITQGFRDDSDWRTPCRVDWMAIS